MHYVKQQPFWVAQTEDPLALRITPEGAFLAPASVARARYNYAAREGLRNALGIQPRELMDDGTFDARYAEFENWYVRQPGAAITELTVPEAPKAVEVTAVDGAMSGFHPFDVFVSRERKEQLNEMRLRRKEQRTFSSNLSKGKESIVNQGYGILSDASAVEEMMKIGGAPPPPAAPAPAVSPVVIIAGAAALALGAILVLKK